MYRPHLVPLLFLHLGLCLKVVPLLLPTGRSTRKVPSVHDKVACMMNSMKNKTKIRFKLNDGNLFPGYILRRFF